MWKESQITTTKAAGCYILLCISCIMGSIDIICGGASPLPPPQNCLGRHESRYYWQIDVGIWLENNICHDNSISEKLEKVYKIKFPQKNSTKISLYFQHDCDRSALKDTSSVQISAPFNE